MYEENYRDNLQNFIAENNFSQPRMETKTNSNKPIKLYIDYISQPARAVLALCKFNNIPHEVVEVRVFRNQQKTSSYAQINPLQKIPALDEEGFTLSESHAMMRYLCNSRNVAPNWYPQNDVKQRARIDVYLDWHHLNTRRCTWFIVATRFPDAPYIKEQNMTAEGEKKHVMQTLKKIEDIFLQDKKFLCGEEMSIADLSACCEIIQLHMVKFDFSPYPKIAKWLERCFESQIMKDVHSFLFSVLTKMQDSKL